MSISRAPFGLVALTALSLLCACGGPQQGRANAVTDREQHAVQDLKTRYKDVVMGTDVQKNTLDVYVDVNNMYSMDEQSEAAMKAQALAEWKRVWTAAHPHTHGTIRLSVRDYYGKEVYASAARV